MTTADPGRNTIRIFLVLIAATVFETATQLHLVAEPQNSGKTVTQDEVVQPQNGGRRVIIGGMDIEDTTSKKVSPYERNQDQAIEYFGRMFKVLDGLGSGQQSSIEVMGDGVTTHLNSVYLYCSIKQGVCPVVLDAILELDVAASKLSGTADCPNLTKFWKAWLRDDYEGRQQFLVKTGFLQMSGEFNQLQRPKYIQCKPTVTAAVQGSPPTALFYRERFGKASSARQGFERTVKLLQAMKDSVPNILVALEQNRTS
jgi:hypothetical protein